MRAAVLRHLTHKAQFAHVLKAPPLAHTAHFALHWRAGGATVQAPMGELHMGVVLPKRWAKRAVTRNALRRQMYAQVEQWSGARLQHGLLVVRLRRAFDRHQYPSAWSQALRDAVRDEMSRLLARFPEGA